jgi:hypothetical protein
LNPRPLLPSLLDLHLEIGRLALPPLPTSITPLIRRIDDDASTGKAAAQAAGTSGVGGVRRTVGCVRVVGDVALGCVVGVCVVDVERLG